MDRRWVFDASPLIALGKIGLLDLLEKLSAECVIPKVVAEEVRAGRDSDPAKVWLPERRCVDGRNRPPVEIRVVRRVVPEANENYEGPVGPERTDVWRACK